MDGGLSLFGILLLCVLVFILARYVLGFFMKITGLLFSTYWYIGFGILVLIFIFSKLNN